MGEGGGGGSSDLCWLEAQIGRGSGSNFLIL